MMGVGKRDQKPGRFYKPAAIYQRHEIALIFMPLL